MKITEDNERCLRAMGFFPEDPLDKTGWWRLKCGWAFVPDKIKNIESLVRRLMSTEFARGQGKDSI